jgi:hypothetical protein
LAQDGLERGKSLLIEQATPRQPPQDPNGASQRGERRAILVADEGGSSVIRVQQACAA